MKFRAALFSVLLLGLVSSAFAVPTLSFQVDGGATTLCADGDACDDNPLAGVVTFNDSLPSGFTVNVTTGITKPIFAGAQMDLNSVVVQTTGGTHDLTIGFSETGFDVAPAGLHGTFGGTLVFGAGSTVRAEAYYDTTNTLFGPGTLSFTIGPFTPIAFAGEGSGPGPVAGPYSLTQYIVLHTVGGGTFSGDFNLQAVPEPVSVSLLGGALLLAAGGLRRRLRKA